VKPYLGWVLLYPGIAWAWTAASMDRDPAVIDSESVRARLDSFPESLRWYSPAVHQAAFALPTFVDRLANHDPSPSSADLRAIGHPLPGSVS
jgi:spermidine synthase